MHDSRTTLILAAMLFLALPVMVWIVLLRLPGRKAAAMWCLGSALAGVGLVLMGLRPWLPQWLSYNVANTCLLASFLGWIQSLRIMLNRPWSVRLWCALAIGCGVFYSVLLGWTSPVERGVGMRVLLSVQSVYTAYCAWQLSRRIGGPNAMTIALAYLLLGLALVTHALWPGGAAVTPNPFSRSWDASLLALTALVTAMIGHFAYVGMTLDIANRDQQEGQAAQQVALQMRSLDMQLQELDRKRHMLMAAGSLAHELSQPLTMAMMNIELAQLHWRAQPRANSMLEGLLGKVQSGVDRTVHILERVRRGDEVSSPDFAALNLNDVVAQSLTMVEPDLKSSDVELSCQYAVEALPCRGDPVALSQVLVNLMRNAVQAIQGRALRQLQVRCFEQADHAVVEIGDTGPGLSQELLQHWGEPFMSTQASGLGLGLAISLDIVKRHAGSLTLCNKTTGGLKATLSIPKTSGGGA